MTTAPVNASITLDDVRVALGETDPATTNASALRTLIGRGSFATIQKHLDAIRAERAPVVPAAPGTAPAVPKDAIDALWSMAWSAAQVHTLSRLETVTAEREQLTITVGQLSADLAAALASVDTAHADAAALSAATDSAMAAADAAAATAAARLEKANADAAAAAETAAKALESLRIDFERLKAKTEAEAAMAARDAVIAAQTMQSTIDALNAQVVQRDVLLAQLAPAPKTKA